MGQGLFSLSKAPLSLWRGTTQRRPLSRRHLPSFIVAAGGRLASDRLPVVGSLIFGFY